MSIVKKVNIDELINVLMDLRKNTEYVDMQINENNILRVKRHDLVPEEKTEKPKKQKPLTDSDLNHLIA